MLEVRSDQGCRESEDEFTGIGVKGVSYLAVRTQGTQYNKKVSSESGGRE